MELLKVTVHTYVHTSTYFIQPDDYFSFLHACTYAHTQHTHSWYRCACVLITHVYTHQKHKHTHTQLVKDYSVYQTCIYSMQIRHTQTHTTHAVGQDVSVDERTRFSLDIELESAVILITPLPDDIYENDEESFRVRIVSVSGGELDRERDEATVTIIDQTSELIIALRPCKNSLEIIPHISKDFNKI